MTQQSHSWAYTPRKPELKETRVPQCSFSSLFSSVSFISTILSSTSLILSSASVILLLVPSECFWSHLLHSLYIDSFFISSRSLLNLSCIFLTLVSRLSICNSILFSRFWIIFTVIIWNYLSGRFSISSSFFFFWFGGHLFCSFTCWVFLCLFILIYIAVFGVAFLYSDSLWFLFIVEVPRCGWGWTGGLSRFPG